MAHDARTRSKARVLYESGKSDRFVEKELNVARNTLIAWAKAGKWVKGKIEPKLHQAKEAGAILAAERAGLTNEHFYRGVRELVEARSALVPTGKGNLSAFAVPSASVHVSRETDGLMVAELLGHEREVIPDLTARAAGLKFMLESFPGLKLATQITVNPITEVLDRVRRRHNP